LFDDAGTIGCGYICLSLFLLFAGHALFFFAGGGEVASCRRFFFFRFGGGDGIRLLAPFKVCRLLFRLLDLAPGLSILRILLAPGLIILALLNQRLAPFSGLTDPFNLGEAFAFSDVSLPLFLDVLVFTRDNSPALAPLFVLPLLVVNVLNSPLLSVCGLLFLDGLILARDISSALAPRLNPRLAPLSGDAGALGLL
jgi:hypothetical protein